MDHISGDCSGSMGGDELEAMRRWQDRRVAAIHLGRAYATLAWLRIHRTRGGWRAHRMAIIRHIITSSNLYLQAGMSRKARAVGRWGEWLRRSMAAAEGWT